MNSRNGVDRDSLIRDHFPIKTDESLSENADGGYEDIIVDGIGEATPLKYKNVEGHGYSIKKSESTRILGGNSHDKSRKRRLIKAAVESARARKHP